MSNDLADVYELPDGFHVARADHLERVETAEGVTLCVLEKATGGNQLVHADVIEYDSLLEHPMTTGVIGFLAVASAFLAPIIAGYLAATTFDGLLALGGAVGGIVAGFGLSNVALYHSVFGDWVFRFLEWNDHKYTIMTRGRGDRA